MSDPAKYRTKEEVEHYKEIDPLLVTQKQLLQMNYATEAELETIEEKIKGIVTESVEFAEKSPYPANEELYRDVYLQPDYPFIHH